MIINICHTCNVSFSKKKNPNREYKYCSLKCMGGDKNKRDSQSKAMKGKPAWNNGDKGMKSWMNIEGLTPGWNKGLKMNNEVWNKGVPNPSFSGENNPQWKGGVTKENDRIRKSIEYKQWRDAVYKRDNYTCQHCFEKESVSGQLEADHIKPFAYYPDLRFDINNGRTLCKDCHSKTETYLNKGRWVNKKKEQYV